MRKPLLAAVGNTIAFIIMITINTVAVVLPLNNKTTGQLSDQYPNLFTPAGFTFSIWSIIYSALLGFIIYQFYVLMKNGRRKNSILSITPYFITNCLLNAAWIVAWHYEQVALSVVIMAMLLLSLTIIHNKLKLSLSWSPLTGKLLIDFPFSIYFGWITIATVANVTTLLVLYNIKPFGLSEVVWTNIMIAVATVITLLVIIKKRNVFFALVACWAFYGIIAKHRVHAIGSAESIVMVAGICIGVLLLACTLLLIYKPIRQ